MERTFERIIPRLRHPLLKGEPRSSSFSKEVPRNEAEDLEFEQFLCVSLFLSFSQCKKPLCAFATLREVE